MIAGWEMLRDRRLQQRQGGVFLLMLCLGDMQVFLNVVLDEAVEEKAGGEKVRIGMVVRLPFFSFPTCSSPTPQPRPPISGAKVGGADEAWDG